VVVNPPSVVPGEHDGPICCGSALLLQEITTSPTVLGVHLLSTALCSTLVTAEQVVVVSQEKFARQAAAFGVVVQADARTRSPALCTYLHCTSCTQVVVFLATGAQDDASPQAVAGIVL